MPTNLRHDPDYLMQLVNYAVEFHDAKKLLEATWTDNIIEYFLYLTLDAIEDSELAKSLVKDLPRLELRLIELWTKAKVKGQDYEGPFTLWWITWTQKKLLLLRHRIDGESDDDEKVSREDFMRRWQYMAEKLRL